MSRKSILLCAGMAWCAQALIAAPSGTENTAQEETDTYNALGNAFREAPAGSEQRRQILTGLEQLAVSSTDAHASEKLLWVGQQYSQSGDPQRAIGVFQILLDRQSSGAVSRAGAGIVRFELGLAQSRLGRAEDAERTWLSLMRDQEMNGHLRATASDHVRTARIQSGDWAGARAVAEEALSAKLGEVPLLYETIARSSRRTGDYATAQSFYARILEEYPEYRPRNRMIYIAKASMVCKYAGDTERIEYLQAMADLLPEYEQYAEAFQEYYNLANSYTIAPAKYQERNESMPINVSQADFLALGFFRKAIDGLKKIPVEQWKNMEFDVVVSGAAQGAVEILEREDRDQEAADLIEDVLKSFPSLPAERTQAMQKHLDKLLVAALGPLPCANRLPAEDLAVNALTGSIRKALAGAQAPASSPEVDLAAVSAEAALEPLRPAAGTAPKAKARNWSPAFMIGSGTVALTVMVPLAIFGLKRARRNSEAT